MLCGIDNLYIVKTDAIALVVATYGKLEDSIVEAFELVKVDGISFPLLVALSIITNVGELNGAAVGLHGIDRHGITLVIRLEGKGQLWIDSILKAYFPRIEATGVVTVAVEDDVSIFAVVSSLTAAITLTPPQMVVVIGPVVAKISKMVAKGRAKVLKERHLIRLTKEDIIRLCLLALTTGVDSRDIETGNTLQAFIAVDRYRRRGNARLIEFTGLIVTGIIYIICTVRCIKVATVDTSRRRVPVEYNLSSLIAETQVSHSPRLIFSGIHFHGGRYAGALVVISHNGIVVLSLNSLLIGIGKAAVHGRGDDGTDNPSVTRNLHLTDCRQAATLGSAERSAEDEDHAVCAVVGRRTAKSARSGGSLYTCHIIDNDVVEADAVLQRITHGMEADTVFAVGIANNIIIECASLVGDECPRLQSGIR